ncbi:MAG: zincin-like metallopeptidase domain-containing protein, partial [Hyphomicrobium sp.]
GQYGICCTSDDYIRLPDDRAFDAMDETQRCKDFHALFFHELIHWTGVKHRLNRNMGARRHDRDFMIEEIIAEFGAAFLLADLEINSVPSPLHAIFVAEQMRHGAIEKRTVTMAIRRASRAAQYITAFEALHLV